MGPKCRRQDAGVVEEAPRPTSEENLDFDLIKDDDPRTFLDAFTDDLAGDGDLSDTEIDYGNESGDEDIDHADESDIPGDESDEDVRVVRPRKQKFKNLDEVMDESKYHPLPEQVPESHTWKPSKNDPTSKSYDGLQISILKAEPHVATLSAISLVRLLKQNNVSIWHNYLTSSLPTI